MNFEPEEAFFFLSAFCFLLLIHPDLLEKQNIHNLVIQSNRGAALCSNFRLLCFKKEKQINLVLVKFSQHTPKMSLPFSLLLACDLVLWQSGGKQKHGTKAVFAPISILTSNNLILESKIAEGAFHFGFAYVLQFV